jgi:hypothetical protein
MSPLRSHAQRSLRCESDRQSDAPFPSGACRRIGGARLTVQAIGGGCAKPNQRLFIFVVAIRTTMDVSDNSHAEPYAGRGPASW